jgi:uncharacterized protein (TIGR03084 family)
VYPDARAARTFGTSWCAARRGDILDRLEFGTAFAGAGAGAGGELVVDRADVLTGVLSDLAAEGAWLDEVVAGLDEPGWRRPTPAPGWTIADTIGHLTSSDEYALLAANDPAAFPALFERILAGELSVDSAAADRAMLPSAELLSRWRAGRADLAAALAAVPDGKRLPWFSSPMSAASMATARLMETWAHGDDVAQALDVPHPATDGLRHIAYLGVRTRDFAFTLNGLTPPAEAFLVRLTAPSGSASEGTVWSWGPDDAAQRVEGTALDFCLLTTQRRHRLDTALLATGPEANRWLDIAQAYVGAPGPGREPSHPA